MTAHSDLPGVTRAHGAVRLPGSKSITLRALLLAALSSGETLLDGVLESDDSKVMLDAMRVLGIDWEQTGEDAIRVRGAGGAFPIKHARIFVGNSGVSTRSLVAALAMSGGHYDVDGVPRMRERPISDLVDGLRQVGADIRYAGADGFPPLAIGPAPIDVTRPVRVRGDVSSQFLTGILQALPLTGKTATVEVVGALVSAPYIEITINLMARFGVDVARDGWRTFTLPGSARYRSPGRYRIEGDASGASYFLAAGAIAGSNRARGLTRGLGSGPAGVRVEGVGADSIQGDVKFADALAQMGADITTGTSGGVGWIEATAIRPLTGIDIDCVAIPDAAMTLAPTALFATGPTTLRGIGSWRVKETDRIAAMATELRKVGASVEEGSDWLRIAPPERLTSAAIDTYDDHRMAMCFSLVSLGDVPIRINDPDCVNKTYPGYFDEFARIAKP
jgi:3-phosphoshikimate 1-carboxyvinyltransferase